MITIQLLILMMMVPAITLALNIQAERILTNENIISSVVNLFNS